MYRFLILSLFTFSSYNASEFVLTKVISCATYIVYIINIRMAFND
jgi:hypothetical protein